MEVLLIAIFKHVIKGHYDKKRSLRSMELHYVMFQPLPTPLGYPPFSESSNSIPLVWAGPPEFHESRQPSRLNPWNICK